MGLLGWGYNEGDNKVSAFRDAFDGGGKGRSGDTFQGGILSNALNMAGVRPHGYNDRQAALQQAAMQQPNGGGGGHQGHVQRNYPDNPPPSASSAQPNYPNYAPPSSSSQLGGLLDQHVMDYLRANLAAMPNPQGMFTNPTSGAVGDRTPYSALRVPSPYDSQVLRLQPLRRPYLPARERAFSQPTSVGGGASGGW